MENVVSVKIVTMTTLAKEARGLSVYSMLDGDALTTVEHLEFAEFAVDGDQSDPCQDIWLRRC